MQTRHEKSGLSVGRNMPLALICGIRGDLTPSPFPAREEEAEEAHGATPLRLAPLPYEGRGWERGPRLLSKR